MAYRRDIEARRGMVEFAEQNGGVLSRHDARSLGVSDTAIRSEVDAGRLKADGRALRVVGAPPNERGAMVMALANAAPTCALDGITGLRAFGLEHFDDDMIHLGGPRNARAATSDRVRFHPQRRWNPDDVTVVHGLRCVRPDVAVLNGALWLPTLRAAATLLTMAAQQHLVDPDELRAAARNLPQRLRRTRDITSLIAELDQGIQSINELDFARGCRARGLPEPTRQQQLRSPSGLWYLDVEFEPYGVHVEINGIQHRLADRAHLDDLKSNETALRDGVPLRFSSLAVREDDDAIYAQLTRALRLRGWSPTESPQRAQVR